MSLPVPKYQNTAGRLLVMLRTITGGNSITNWANKTDLGLQGGHYDEGPGLAYLYLKEVQAMVAEVFLEIKSCTTMEADPKELLWNGLQDLNEIIYPTNFNEGMRAPSAAMLNMLEMAAAMLPRETALRIEDLDKIRQSISELESLVRDGHINGVLKKSLLELIRLSTDSISRYHIVGAKGLKAAFKTMLGEAMNLHAETERGRQEGKAGYEEHASDQTAWDAIKKHLVVFDAVMVKAGEYLPVMEFISKIPQLH